MGRVAFVAQPRDRLDPASRSSVGIVIAHLAGQMSRLGWDTSLFAQDALAARGDPLLSGVKLEQCPINGSSWSKFVEFRDGQWPGEVPFTMTPGYFKGYFTGVAARLAKVRPDVIHLPGFPAQLELMSDAVPAAQLVVHLHDELLAHLPRTYLRRCLAPAAMLLCVNSHVLDRMRHAAPWLGGRLQLLHNGVSVERFSAASGAPVHGRVLAVGRISPEKGVHVLAEAVAGAGSHISELRLAGSPGLLPWAWVRRIAASDPCLAGLEKFYGREPLSAAWLQGMDRGRHYLGCCRRIVSRVPFTLTGFMPHDRLAAEYASASVVASPSVCGEVPMSMFEALAASRPVVATGDRCNEGPLVDRETALIVPRNDPGALQEAICRLLGDARLARRLAESGRKRVLARHCWQAVATRLLNLYCSL